MACEVEGSLNGCMHRCSRSQHRQGALYHFNGHRFSHLAQKSEMSYLQCSSSLCFPEQPRWSRLLVMSHTTAVLRRIGGKSGSRLPFKIVNGKGRGAPRPSVCPDYVFRSSVIHFIDRSKHCELNFRSHPSSPLSAFNATSFIISMIRAKTLLALSRPNLPDPTRLPGLI